MDLLIENDFQYSEENTDTDSFLSVVRKPIKAVYVFPDGNIGIHGNNIKIGNVADGYCAGGVRPVMWVNME